MVNTGFPELFSRMLVKKKDSIIGVFDYFQGLFLDGDNHCLELLYPMEYLFFQVYWFFPGTLQKNLRKFSFFRNHTEPLGFDHSQRPEKTRYNVILFPALLLNLYKFHRSISERIHRAIRFHRIYMFPYRFVSSTPQMPGAGFLLWIRLAF